MRAGGRGGASPPRQTSWPRVPEPDRSVGPAQTLQLGLEPHPHTKVLGVLSPTFGDFRSVERAYGDEPRGDVGKPLKSNADHLHRPPPRAPSSVLPLPPRNPPPPLLFGRLRKGPKTPKELFVVCRTSFIVLIFTWTKSSEHFSTSLPEFLLKQIG